MRFSGFAGCGVGLSGDVGGITCAVWSSTSGVISVSTSGVSGTNGEDFIKALDIASFVPLQVKHRDAEPKTFLSHVWHLLNELVGSVAAVDPGPGVTGSFGAGVEAMFMSGFDIVRDVSEFPTLIELGRLDSRGSTLMTFCSALLLAAPSVFDIGGRSHEDSGMLDETAAGRRGGERLVDRSSVGLLRISLGDRSGE
jgi:hypothetical protein